MARRSNKRMRSPVRTATDSTALSDAQWRSIFTPTAHIDDIPMWRAAEDGRFFNPDAGYEPAARNFHTGRPARFSVSVSPFHTVHGRSVVSRSYFTGMPRGFQVPVGVKFSNPLSVVACVRRKVRRAVMFAKGKTRKGSGSRHRRFNSLSNVRC